MIPEEVIEEIRSRVNIAQVIGEVVKLKRSGQNLSGLCPFHNEKSPSFSVNEDKQLYYCFGCGEGGSLFTFLTKFHRYSFPEAIEYLASGLGMDLSQYKGSKNDGEWKKKQKEKEDILKALDFAQECFHKSLMKSKNALEARNYLLDRGISEEDRVAWKLGFAPAGGSQLWDVLQKKGFDQKTALEAGLIRKHEGRPPMDTFRNRVMFPIFSHEGKTLGFGGRVLAKDQGPKYLNSSETKVFSKRKVLFGLLQSKETIRKTGQVIVVEGYTDVLALHKYGFTNAVATLGTSLTPEHGQMIKKFTDRMILIFDGDAAGQAAAKRAMTPLLSEGLDVRAVFLPSSMDPDDYLQKNGAKALKNEIFEAKSLLENFIAQEFLPSNLAQKTQAISDLSSLVKQTKNAFVREALLDDISRLTRLDKEIIQGNKGFETRHGANIPKKLDKKPNPSFENVITEDCILVRLIAEIPELRKAYRDKRVSGLLPERVASSLDEWLPKIDETPSASAWVDMWPDEELRPHLAKVFLDETLKPKENWERIWNDCLGKLKKRKIKRLSSELASLEASSESGRVQEVFAQIEFLKKGEAEFSKH